MVLGGAGTAVPAPGQVLGGKYLIHRLLGEGGMALVFEAHHQRLGQRVAVKLLQPDFARDEEIVARFEREARALALLKSRHVARVTDVDATLDGLPYIVMEFLEGRDLDAELQERGHLPHEEAIDYLLQTCAAMAEAHAAGIVHRDLKPANLFLANDNGERVVKVLDFGISKVVGESTRLTGSGAVMGTVLYMSPEQVRGTQDVDTRADIWALGLILYELIAGRAPWQGGAHQIAAAIVSTDAADVRTFAQVPEPVANAIRTALARDRNQRFATVRELAGALAPFAARGSLGAQLADQLVSGHSSQRMRPAYASISGASGAYPAASLQPVSSPHPSLPASLPIAPPPPSEGPKARTFVVIGAVLGVLAAIGIVLTLVAIGARRQPPTPSPAVAETPPPPSAVAAASETSPVPEPPSTGLGADTTTPTAPTTTASAKSVPSATVTVRKPMPTPPALPTATTAPTSDPHPLHL